MGTHAFLSPSSPAWVNYDEDKLDRVFYASLAAQRGTDLHELAHRLIRLKVKLPENGTTLSLYVNDAIGFGMTPEQLLYYSDNCYGHADCVGFRNNTLRIHDLKTGATEAPFIQLEIYAALFCLEYKFKPTDIKISLRIYQNDQVKELVPDIDHIFHIIDKIVTHDRRLSRNRLGDLP
jgi:hypothetical protein